MPPIIEARNISQEFSLCIHELMFGNTVQSAQWFQIYVSVNDIPNSALDTFFPTFQVRFEGPLQANFRLHFEAIFGLLSQLDMCSDVWALAPFVRSMCSLLFAMPKNGFSLVL